MRTVDRKLQEINAHIIIADIMDGKDGDINYRRLSNTRVVISDFSPSNFEEDLKDIDLAYFGNSVLPLVFNEEENGVLAINNLAQIIQSAGTEEENEYNEHEKQFPVIKPEFRASETASVVKLKTGEYVTIRNDGEIIKKKVDK